MMNLTFAPKDVLQMDDAKLVYKNFKGEGSKFNRAGDKHFSVVIETQEQYEALMDNVNKYGDPWNVKVRDPREEGDEPFRTLSVKVKFNENGPAVYLYSGKAKTKLTESSIAILDDIEIARVDLDIRPYDGEINGKTYRAAYLKAIKVVQEIDRFAEDFIDDEDDDDFRDQD